jgi:hypothetical protein
MRSDVGGANSSMPFRDRSVVPLETLQELLRVANSRAEKFTGTVKSRTNFRPGIKSKGIHDISSIDWKHLGSMVQ